ncbi:hypothetical protein HOD38_01015 [archaeon]|jgi:hypothetical protein|nr:hypothetical protein [archaeon]MBT4396824.1 hypothetical protein [archaeon]MBT4441498.1 hypothetical protein [archaeon]
MDKRAVFFTLDAIIATFTAIILLGIIFFYFDLVDIRDMGDNELLEYSRSVVSVMEENGDLADTVVTGSNESVLNFLANYTKTSTCFNLTFYDSSMTDLGISFLKRGCEEVADEKDVVRRSFVVQDSVYLVKMEAYYE